MPTELGAFYFRSNITIDLCSPMADSSRKSYVVVEIRLGTKGPLPTVDGEDGNHLAARRSAENLTLSSSLSATVSPLRSGGLVECYFFLTRLTTFPSCLYFVSVVSPLAVYVRHQLFPDEPVKAI
jgi:hypothetical protein